MVKIEVKSQARQLREDGRSIRDISRLLNVAKSTVSGWVRDIVLTDEQILRLSSNANKGIKKGQAVHSKLARLKREKSESFGYERASQDEFFRLLCMLYWGEGTKTGFSFSVANCDPDMLCIVFSWLAQEGHFNHITFSVTYHDENGFSEDEIKSWWMKKIPGLNTEHCRKFTVKDTSKTKHKDIGKVPYGTAYIRVNSVQLLQQVLGGIRYLRSNALYHNQ